MRPHVLTLIGLLCGTQLAWAETTLCRADEQVLFHCRIERSSKQLSMCGSSKLTAKAGYLQYRFGTPDKIELAFPKDAAQSQLQFRLAHYFRYQVDRSELSFDNAGYRYTLFADYEGEVKPATKTAGVTISQADKQLHELSCAKSFTNRLATLDEVVPCDADNALSMGCGR